jgi:hypothetical protein
MGNVWIAGNQKTMTREMILESIERMHLTHARLSSSAQNALNMETFYRDMGNLDEACYYHFEADGFCPG